MNLLKSCLLILISFFSCSVSAQKKVPQKKVVFIIVDGIADDMLDKSETPNLNRIKKDGAMLKAYVGGEKGGYSETPTISAVGYNSLLTGTWVNKHNVYDNDIKAPNSGFSEISFQIKRWQYSPRGKITGQSLSVRVWMLLAK